MSNTVENGYWSLPRPEGKWSCGLLWIIPQQVHEIWRLIRAELPVRFWNFHLGLQGCTVCSGQNIAHYTVEHTAWEFAVCYKETVQIESDSYLVLGWQNVMRMVFEYHCLLFWCLFYNNLYVHQSISFTKSISQCTVKKCLRETNCRSEKRTHALHHIAGCCESIDQEIKTGLKGPPPPFDPPTSGAPLKSPSFSHLLPLQLPLYKAAGCWVHTIQLCRLRDAKGHGAEVSFKSGLPRFAWHQFPVQSLVFLLCPLLFTLVIQAASC